MIKTKHTKKDRRKRRGLKTKAIQSQVQAIRLVVYRSSCHIYSQIIESGENGDTVLVSSSSLDKELKATLTGSKVEQALQVGKLLGKRAQAKQISNVAFDRSGYKYHGRVKAVADGAREAGLIF